MFRKSFLRWKDIAEFPLPDTYGRSTGDLAALLNRVRAERRRAPGELASD